MNQAFASLCVNAFVYWVSTPSRRWVLFYESFPSVNSLQCPEIEALLGAHIISVLAELNESRHSLDEIRGHIVKALENDGDWVALYNATRELRVKQNALPDLPNTGNSAVITKVTEIVINVGFFCFLLFHM